MNITMYTRTSPPCPYCNQAKALANSKNLSYENIDIGTDITLQEFKEKFPNVQTVPLIIVDDNIIGGFMEFRKFVTSQELGDMSL